VPFWLLFICKFWHTLEFSIFSYTSWLVYILIYLQGFHR
jgi:hypothetical protein